MSSAKGSQSRTHVRFYIVTMLFFVTSMNYASRSTLSIAGPQLSKELGISAIQMGYIFSGFGWSYVLAQIPGGWLLDRFGSKWIYALSLILWSVLTMLQGGVGFLGGGAVVALFSLRFLVGLAEAPSFPANSRIVTAWFPGSERGTASAFFNSGQYFATVMFAPLMGWIALEFGWRDVFYVMGAIGIVMGLVWIKTIYPPGDHPNVNKEEISYIRAGGGLVELDTTAIVQKQRPRWHHVKQLLISRMMIGIYVAQYCINALSFFFITWFPIYLVQARGMTILKAGLVASVPAICGFAGGVLGGVISDWIMRAGGSLSTARRVPIIAGMLLSITMVLCNYADAQVAVIALMSMAFFGKGIGALGWAVSSDTCPKQIAGLSGAIFNACGNLSSITTPIAVGYIVALTGSFNGALVFVAAHSLLAAACYLFVVTDIHRIELV